MPKARLGHFNLEISRARDIVGLGQSIGSLTLGRVDSADLYRAALVQGVAALDSYIHGIILDRAVDVLLGRTINAGRDAKIGLHFAAIARIVGATSTIDQELAARSGVAERLALETYQRPDDIARGLAMVGIPRIWSIAFPAPESAKTGLKVIVSRRNRIVHQCDGDPLTPGQITPLTAEDALDSITTVEATVRGIDQYC